MATWGRIANQELDGQKVKAVFFFAGNWKSAYNVGDEDRSDGPNDCVYTIHPADGRHLRWSIHKTFAIDEMLRAGVNTVAMSYWGERGSDRWRFFAPMQTSTEAHDELFEEVIGRGLFIMPVIEDADQKTELSPAYAFSKDFPPDDVAGSALVKQIEDLIQRYLQNWQKPRWKQCWLQMYDRDGLPRYAIHIILAKSEIMGLFDRDALFAAGFDAIADYIFQRTQFRIGFTINAVLPAVIRSVPPPVRTEVYYPLAREAGPELRRQRSILAIQGFIPEISISAERTESERIKVKKDYVEGWAAQQIPVMADLTPGYDAHLVFSAPPNAPPHFRPVIYGNNARWRRDQLALLPDRFAGVVYNTWNGYTEGYAAVPTTEHGDANFQWLQRVFRKWFDVLPNFVPGSRDRWRTEPGTPVTAVWHPSGARLDLFIIGSKGEVWTTWWEPGLEWGGRWSVVPTVPGKSELSLKMALRARISAVWREPGKHLDLFVTGPDGTVWTTWWNDAWNDARGWRMEGWLRIHSNRKMSPGATVTALWRQPGQHLDLFATDSEGTVWTIFWNNAVQWRPEGWLPIPSEPKMSPGARVRALWRQAGVHLDLFATDRTGAVRTIWWNDTVGWRPEGWMLLHPETRMEPGAPVAALWREPGKHLDLFVTGKDGSVWSIWWNDSAGWRPEGWMLIHPETKMKPGATVTALWRPQTRHLDLFATNRYGHVLTIWWNETEGWRREGWFRIGDSFAVEPGQPITAGWSTADRLDLFATGPDGAVVSAFWEPDLGW